MVDAISVFFILKRAVLGARFGGADEEEAAVSGDGAGVEGISSWIFVEVCVGGLSFLAASSTILSVGGITLVSFLDAEMVKM